MERTFVRKALTEQMFGVIIYPEKKTTRPVLQHHSGRVNVHSIADKLLYISNFYIFFLYSQVFCLIDFIII